MGVRCSNGQVSATSWSLQHLLECVNVFTDDIFIKFKVSLIGRGSQSVICWSNGLCSSVGHFRVEQ